MLALVSFSIVILFSIVVVKIGSVALEATGLSSDIAAFQAQSAFSGVGFTTEESESLMGHPLRRRIVRFLMLMGSAGLTSAIATLILTFTSGGEVVPIFSFRIDRTTFNIIVIISVLIFLFLITRTKGFDDLIRFLMAGPLRRLKRKVQILDYEKVLGLSKGYAIGSFEVPKRHWMVNKTIGQLELEKEDLMVLGVYRELHSHQEYLGIPTMDFKIRNRDKIMVYGKEAVITNIAKRERGSKGRKEREAAILMKQKMDIIRRIDEEKLQKLINGR